MPTAANTSKINPNPFTTRPEIEGTFGVVTTTHWIATAVGMAALEKGGNAFDAAVATAFTLQVVEPHLNGPGGDVPVIVHDVKRGKTEVICGQGPAPAGATIQLYANGLGPVTNQPASGDPAPSASYAETPTPIVMIGTQQAQVLFSGLTPGAGGLYALNVIVPASLAPGPYPVTVSISGRTSVASTIVVH